MNNWNTWIKRIIFDLILFISLVTLPWWIGGIITLAGLFYFNRLYEVILVGLIIDSLYGSNIVFSNFPYIATTLSVIILFLVGNFKKRLIMY